jgi:signal transduction histidine kinase
MTRPSGADDQAGRLAEAAAALHLASRVAQVGVWEVDFVNDQVIFSPTLCELLGGPLLPAMSISDAELFWVEDDRHAFRGALDGVRTLGERLTFEGRSVDPDGLIKWWRLLGEPEFAGTQCVGARGAAQNITEWRDALQRERAALRAADEMSEFMATMSHEIRTPLNGILGMAQALGRGELSGPQRERLGVIETSGAGLLSLLDDLLDMSKIEAGKIEFEKGVVDTLELAKGAHALFAALVQDKNVSFHLTLAPSARGYWVGDPKRIRQVLHNLISNAVKFTDNGSVTFDLSYVSERLILRVEDTGICIPPERLTDVFERVAGTDASRTPRHRGSGLGLNICRDLVSLMHGDMQVQSVQGVGATFVVSLPLARAGALEPPEPVDQQYLCADIGLRVLAAEDNSVNQLVLKTLLGAAGIEPVFVWNGQEALEAWRADEWDIVLMDIQMPVMDGLTAVKLLREAERRESRRRTPIIAVTANAMAHQTASYLAADMDAVVAKPINLSCLLQSMDTALG